MCVHVFINCIHRFWFTDLNGHAISAIYSRLATTCIVRAIPGSVKIFYDYFIINTEEISKPEAIIEIDLLIYRIIIFIVARLNELLSRLPCLWRGVWKTNLFIPPSFTSPDKVCWICEVCFLVMVSLEPSALKLSTNYHR